MTEKKGKGREEKETQPHIITLKKQQKSPYWGRVVRRMEAMGCSLIEAQFMESGFKDPKMSPYYINENIGKKRRKREGGR